ncbi:hypothetical protein RJ639_036435 [Escallonia herrerae]|uniref:Histone-lysine N-methyltransferase ASHR1 n=1 Tax=Escallonia herrerae TaxID=1293975 RepID=A0AA89B8R6_9ASTE|nr:hypothetical protein RJ639_036435 [Escallonia herrerae]
MEELQRTLSEKGITVKTLPEKGRCLFSTRDFSPGDVILSEEPYVSVPNRTSTESRCDCCFASSKLRRCSICQVVRYCGSTCQKSDWKLHRLECQALARLGKDRLKYLTPTIRLMVKLYLKRKLQTEKMILCSAVDNYNLVEALVSHISEVNEKQLVLYAQMANLVNLILQWPDITVKEIAEMFSKLACNAHTICDSELRPLGTGLYPVTSIINHSCFSNSVLVFEGKMAVIRAVQSIPEGTEVFISYIETAGSTMTRQKALKEQYYFTCTCPRCMKVGQYDDIQESATLEGYRCKDNGCNGFLLRSSDNNSFICQQCGLTRDKEDIKKITGEVNLLSEKASMLLSSGHNAEAIPMYSGIEKLQQKLYHPSSVNLMRTRETLLKILMELHRWEEALAYCRWTIPVYQRVYPEIHPSLGLQYYTCGKLECACFSDIFTT